MTRSAPKFAVVGVLALAAVALGFRRLDSPEAVQPSAGPGSIRLEPRGANCVLADKSPATTVVAAGGTFSWVVRNNCSESVTLDMREKRRRNSDATTDDPVSSFSHSPNPIPARTQGTVNLRVKTQEELRPDAQRRPRKHVWEFRWFVNGQRQSDPELEVEYRW